MNKHQNETSPVIGCYDLYKTYAEGDLKVDVLKGLNFEVYPGEMVAVIGASGVGKSTLLQLLGSLDKPTSGRVMVAGQDAAELNEKAKGRLRNQYLGFVYQFHHLLPEFDALENVCMPLLIRGLDAKTAISKANKIIDQVGLQARARHRISELSGGERQRIAIARALVTEPKCVLADEPTGNLDQQTAGHVYELMLQLNENLGTSFVVVTHNERLAQRLDKVYVLKAGHLEL